jgi:hypothetical protein
VIQVVPVTPATPAAPFAPIEPAKAQRETPVVAADSTETPASEAVDTRRTESPVVDNLVVAGSIAEVAAKGGVEAAGVILRFR